MIHDFQTKFVIVQEPTYRFKIKQIKGRQRIGYHTHKSTIEQAIILSQQIQYQLLQYIAYTSHEKRHMHTSNIRQNKAQHQEGSPWPCYLACHVALQSGCAVDVC